VTTPLRRRIRHARRWLGYGALVLLIALALLVGVANQMLPMVERHPAQISAWLSARVGEPVTFSSARAEWTRRGPRFTLEGLHVGLGANRLNVGRAQLLVAMYSGLLPGQPLTELKIRELALTLVQGADGRWQVVGLPGQESTVDPLSRLEGFGELQIEKAQLAIHAPLLRIDMHVPRIDARVRVDGPRLRVGVAAWVDAADAPLTAVLDFQRRRGDGRLWIGADNLSLAHWAPLLASIGVVPEQGSGKLDVWARLRDQRIRQVTVQADFQQARLRSLKPLQLADATLRPARVDFERLQTTARWTATANGWWIQAPHLDVTQNGRVARLDKLQIDGGRLFRLTGKELDLSPLAAMLSLSDRFPASLRLFLLQSNPQASLRDVAIVGRRDGPWRGAMTITRLSLQAHDQRPGLSGLAGRLQFDERGGVMRLDGSPVHVEWPVALRQPEDVRLDGSVALWKSGPGWTLGSNELRLQGQDFGADLRLQLGFQGDGSAPTMDLAAKLDPASFATAKRFWILHKMPPATVRWLDAALVSGRVLDGRIAIAGDLDDWPFRNHAGGFDARARIADATLKFNKDWPAAEHLGGDLVFDGLGFRLVGSAAIQGNQVSRVDGGIADFHSPLLDLQLSATGAGEKLRQLLIASPLYKDYGEHMRAVTITGDTRIELAMQLPLHEGAGQKKIEGSVELARGSLADSRWDIAFTDVSGLTRFTGKGFATEDLKVRVAQQPGVFNLRVGEQTGDRAVAAVAGLAGRFTVPTLLDRYADLAWLKPWVTGASNWKLTVRVPASTGNKSRQPPSQLQLSSDLVGASIGLPAPLKKPASATLPLDLQMALPIEQGELNLRLGNVMRLRGQVRKGQPLTGAIQFGDGALAPSPARGLSVRGNVGVLDSFGWVAFSGQGGADTGSVHDVDVQAAQLLFLDRPFADSHLQLTRSASATQVAIKGKGIDGSVENPGQIARGVQGRFARLYLHATDDAGAKVPGAGAGAAVESQSGATVAAAAVPTVENPAALPPLRFNIADLRIGQAQLGKAELVTTPTASGMRVDKFQTQARNMTLSAAGEWLRTGAGTRSNFRLDFRARSLGQMLDALGFTDMVEDGVTKATLTGSWPGSPGAFTLATLSGSLKADIGQGRLLDVEPGGSGRILGLLSLAEIPRRLSLDFSDFFKKGFAFNNARGDFVFSDGKARTDNLRIDGPAAEIRVSGTTGLRDQVYDQRVEVLPKAGGLLPAIGLLAGGPAGAAVGAMAQAVLQRPLKQTTRVVYRVTGPWQKPLVKVVEKGPSRAPATADNGAAPARP
jgi:uncharacterized protein (TIGR02099 family)